jgi:hypothetical protein
MVHVMDKRAATVIFIGGGMLPFLLDIKKSDVFMSKRYFIGAKHHISSTTIPTAPTHQQSQTM